MQEDILHLKEDVSFQNDRGFYLRFSKGLLFCLGTMQLWHQHTAHFADGQLLLLMIANWALFSKRASDYLSNEQ